MTVYVSAANYAKFVKNKVESKGVYIFEEVLGIIRKKTNIRRLLVSELILVNKIRTENGVILCMKETTVVVIMYLARWRWWLIEKFQRVE